MCDTIKKLETEEYNSLIVAVAHRAAAAPNKRTTDVRLADMMRDSLGCHCSYGAETSEPHGTAVLTPYSWLEWDDRYQRMTARSREVLFVSVTDHTGTHWMKA